MLAMDVTSDSDVRVALDVILNDQGRIDLVVNNAGFGIGGAVEDTSVEEARMILDTNFLGALRVCRAALPTMRAQRSGLIVNISSVGGRMGLPFQGLYSASKFALEGLSEALRMEVKPFGIHVVLVEPGDIRSEFTANRRSTHLAGVSDVYRAQYERTLRKIEEDENNGRPPEIVARTLLRVTRSKRPRPRYIAGALYEKLAVYVKCYLPDHIFERILMANYGIEL